MHKLLRRVTLAACLTAALAGFSATPASAEEGCIGVPAWGSTYYHCVAFDTSILPDVSLSGSTPVGTTIPAICYFLDCTEPIPVGTSVPVEVTTTQPSGDVTVFEFGFSCYWSSTSCAEYYTLRYDRYYDVCYFETSDPEFSALDGQSVPCTL